MNQNTRILNLAAFAFLLPLAGCGDSTSPTISNAPKVDLMFDGQTLNYSLEVPIDSAQQDSVAETWVDFRFTLTDNEGLHTYRQWASGSPAFIDEAGQQIALIARAEGSIQFGSPLPESCDTLTVVLFVDQASQGTALRSHFRTPEHNKAVNRSIHSRGN